MKLLELSLENVLGAPSITLSFAQGAMPAPIVLVAGSGGCGKTSVLRAIAAAKEAVGPYRRPPTRRALLRRGSARGLIAATWYLEPDEREATGGASTYESRLELGGDGPYAEAPAGVGAIFRRFMPGHGKLELFGADRGLLPIVPERPPADEVALRACEAQLKYQTVGSYLISQVARDGLAALTTIAADGILIKGQAPDRCAAIARDFARFVPDMRFTGISSAEGRPSLAFRHRDGTEVGLEQLSASEAQALLFATTFQRFALTGSLVLVDDPTLHVATDQQPAFFQALATLGPDNQIIAATGSSALLRAASPEQIRWIGPA